MIRCFDIPRELIYMGKGENGYEKYMADDPTGINQVLDEMYGVVFNDASAQLNFDEASHTYTVNGEEYNYLIVPMKWR